MKTILTLLTAILLALPLMAEEKVQAGPRGGRVLSLDGENAEFFVEKDRKVSITMLDAALKPKDMAAQTATVTAEAPSGKVKLTLEKQGNALVSTEPLPEGEYQMVVQLRAQPDAKPKNFRIPLNLHVCGGCQKAEYACTCGH